MLAPGLARARDEGRPCYLETADAATLPFYERLGFAVTGTAQVDGLRLWGMARPPDGQSAASMSTL